MRLATLRAADGTRAALLDEDRTWLLAHPTVGEALAAGVHRGGSGVDREPGPSAHEADYAPLLPHAGKIVCVGHNYEQHILEMGHGLPEHPTLFSKFASALVGAYDDVCLDLAAQGWDWEAELAVVIGSPVRHADGAQAREAIAGFTVANDVSARDWQRRTAQWLAGKSWDATTPLGPVLVTSDEVGGAADLLVTCSVDGVEKQRARTSDLLFGPEELVAYVSTFTRLEPGDVLLTGTPAGVGAARTPPEQLRPGLLLETTIEVVGTCRNACVPS